MKLLRYRSHGQSRLGLLAGDGIVDIDDLRGAFTDMRGIVAGGSAALDAVRERRTARAHWRSPTRICWPRSSGRASIWRSA